MAKKRIRHRNPEPFVKYDDSAVSRKRTKLPKTHLKEDKLISLGMSSKILKEALLQQKEIQNEVVEEQNPNSSLLFASVEEPQNYDDEVEIDELAGLEETQIQFGDYDEEDIDEFAGFEETQIQFGGYDEEAIDEDDERLLEAFLSNDVGPQRTLADHIAEKIKEKDAAVSSEARPLPKLDNNIIDLYKGVGKLLSNYTSGKMPKAFKHIPSMQHWEYVLYLTEPENWSANAMYQATRIFASNMGIRKAERFYRLVLLPRVREDIRKNNILHFALHQALKKSLYKPAAFFKGILFPLCESRTCTLREAVKIGSVLKCRIPVEHSSVAIVKLAEMEYCGTTSYFIKLFFEKNYGLPYRVLDAAANHFMRFVDDSRMMPVIWHQSLLAFVQKFKNGLRKEDKDDLRKLIEVQKHRLVTPEICRELDSSRNQREKEDDLMSIATPSVINKTIEEDRFDVPEVPMEED